MVNLNMPSAKIQPQQVLPRYRRIISLDLEATNFFDETMAVAASYQETVQLEDGYWTGAESGYWFQRIDYSSRPNDYVAEYILPVLEKPYDGIEPPVPVTQAMAMDEWSVQHRTLASIGFVVVTHVPFPVETEFLGFVYRSGRMPHPFPVIDVCSMILQSGYRGDPTDLMKWWMFHFGKLPSWYVEHHPLADARLAGSVYWHLMGAKTMADS